MDAREIAEKGLIVKAMVGSKAHGLAMGEDDTDIMGVCIEPQEYVIGMKNFEQYVFRQRAVGERSQPGDEEGVIYSLRKFTSLACKGNPTILIMLYVEPLYQHDIWKDLVEDYREWCPSKKAGQAFLGYMIAQRQRLQGERGQMRVHRPELVEKYGFDTKYAGHIIRLGYQGVEFMTTRKLSIPMREDEAGVVRAVRRGDIPYNSVLTMAGVLEKELKEAIDTSPLPDEPAYDLINAWLVSAYQQKWREC